MKKEFKTEYKGHSVVVENGPTECKLIIDGKVTDVYWGIFALRVKLTGTIEDESGSYKVKAILGTKFIKVLCAVFINDELVLTNTKI